MNKTIQLMRYLNNRGIQFQVISHVPAYTAHQVAMASHVPDERMAKTVLVKAGQISWLVVVRADQKIDERKLKRVLETPHVTLVHEEDLETIFPGCEVGAMPPIGALYGLAVVMDRSFADDEEILFNACTHTDSIRMKFADYEKLVKPILADIAKATSDEPEMIYF